MKGMRWLDAIVAVAIVALVMVARGPTVWAANAGAGLAGTDHDFTLGGTYGNTTVGLCTYCHTPHHAKSTLLLWNHTLSNNTFVWDVTKTTAGTDYPSFTGNTYKGPTAKCLSCHDGSVAPGDLGWFDGRKPVGLNTNTIPSSSEYSVGFGGSMSGNHPVAMPYPYGGVPNTYNGVTTGSAFVPADWLTPPTGKIQLYNMDSGDPIAGPGTGTKAGIECSSCHDPHNKQTDDDYFLRGKLTGDGADYICLECHIK
jgi:hypothetical protein